jgi:hypothetical protein
VIVVLIATGYDSPLTVLVSAISAVGSVVGVALVSVAYLVSWADPEDDIALPPPVI